MKKIGLIVLFLIIFIPFVEAGLKEDLIGEQARIEKEIPLTKFNSLLPIKGEGLCFDTNETVFITIEKDGKLGFYGKGEDFYVVGKYRDMHDIVMMEDIQEIADNINRVNVYPRSMKGKIGIRFAEVFYGIKISASNNFSDKVVKFFTTPAAWFAKGLIKIF